MRVVILIGEGIVKEIFVRGSVYIEGCSEDFMYFFSFLSILDTLFLYIGLDTVLTYIVLIFDF